MAGAFFSPGNQYMASPTPKRIFFPNLDGLRVIAFLMVYLWHTLKTPFEMLGVSNVWLRQLFYFFINGKTGVSVFFVLSGFLITYLLLAEIAANGRVSVFRFYTRRALRIWPLYFLILLVVFFGIRTAMWLLHLNWSQYDMRACYYFLFIGNFDVLRIYLQQGTDLLPSTVTWSVAIEEQFYLVWPLLFAFIPPRTYKFIFPCLLLVAYVFRAFHADHIAVLNFHTLSVCGDLAMGGWAAWLSFTNKKFVQLFHQLPNQGRWVIYTVSLVLLYLGSFIEHSFTQVFARLFQTLFFAWVILDQNFSGQQQLKLSNNRQLTYWGKYTYGLYLWHPVVLLLLTMVLTRISHLALQGIGIYLVMAPVGLVATMLVSYLSYHYVEAYFLKWKEKFAIINSPPLR